MTTSPLPVLRFYTTARPFLRAPRPPRAYPTRNLVKTLLGIRLLASHPQETFTFQLPPPVPPSLPVCQPLVVSGGPDFQKCQSSFLCRTASAPRVFGTDRLQGLRTKSSPFSTKSREVLLHQAFEVMSKSLPSSDEGLQAVDILCQDCTRIPASSSTCRRKSLLSHSNTVARSGIPSGTVFNHYHSLRDISSQHLTAEPVSQNWWGTGVLPGRLTQGTYARAWVHASIS